MTVGAYSATSDGSAELSEHLTENYDRKTITEICDDKTLALKGSGLPPIEVWVNKDNEWSKIDRAILVSMWVEKIKSNPQSVCRMMIKDLFGLSESQYKLIRHEFDSQESGDLVGIYKAKDGKNVTTISLVVRVPKSVWERYKKVGTGMLVGTVGALAVGAITNRLGWWGKKRSGSRDGMQETPKVVNSDNQQALDERIQSFLSGNIKWGGKQFHELLRDLGKQNMFGSLEHSSLEKQKIYILKSAIWKTVLP